MGLGIPPLRIKIMLESSPLKSTMLVGRLGADGNYSVTRNITVLAQPIHGPRVWTTRAFDSVRLFDFEGWNS